MEEFGHGFGSVEPRVVQVVGFGRRLVAYLLDYFILTLINVVIGFCAGFLLAIGSGGSNNSETLDGITPLFYCVGFLISAAYLIGFWATIGQTPGKMALDIKVISTDGQSPSWGKATLRYLGYIVSSVVLLLGFLWLAFDERRQGWHDKIAGTYVVRKDTHFSLTENINFQPSDPGQGWIWIVVMGVFVIATPICIIALLLLLGPVIGDVFSNIVEGLEP